MLYDSILICEQSTEHANLLGFSLVCQNLEDRESEEAFIKEVVRSNGHRVILFIKPLASLYTAVKQLSSREHLYFVGEHLSVYQRWMVGVLDSA